MVVLIAAAFLVASCAVAPPLPVSGNTTTSPRLQKDTIGILSVAFRAKSKCAKIEAVETEILSVDPGVRVNANGVVTEGIIKERWTAIGCGQRVPLDVTFTPDGKGGAFIGFRI